MRRYDGQIRTLADLKRSFEDLRSTVLTRLSQGYRLGETIYIAANGNFEKADYPGLRALGVGCQGGGGAGGGAPATSTGQISIGAPGGAGCYAYAFVAVDDLDVVEAIVVGAGGTGASGTTGGVGGATSFDTISGSVSADGGNGGNVLAAGNTDATVFGGAGSATGVGDIVIGGDHGRTGYRLLGNAAASESGGKSHLGTGGLRPTNNNAGNPGVQGGGGSGTVNGASQSARTGAAGGAGLVVVELFY